jgi:hypothetical protein
MSAASDYSGDPLFMDEVCAACGVQGKTKKLLRCRLRKYCSRACQTKDWPTHKVDCQRPPSKAELQQTGKSNEFWYKRVMSGCARSGRSIKRTFRLRSGRSVEVHSDNVLPSYPTDLPGGFRFYFPAHDVIKSIGDAHEKVLAITRIEHWQSNSYFDNIAAVQKNVEKMFDKKGRIDKVFARTDYAESGTPQVDANKQWTHFIEDIILLLFQRWARGEPAWALCSTDADVPLDDAMEEYEAYSCLLRLGMREVYLDPTMSGASHAQITAAVQANVNVRRGSTDPPPGMFIMRFPLFNPLRHPPFMHT